MKLLKSVLQLKALMKPRKCVHMVICLSEIPTLIYFVSVADALENGASFILLQFLVGMYRVWHSVTVLFLLLAQKFIKKTSHSSGLRSWGFKWRSVLWLCICTASSLPCLLRSQHWWLYSGLPCPLGLCIYRPHQHMQKQGSAAFRYPCHHPLLFPHLLAHHTLPDTATHPREGMLTGTARALVRSNAGKGSNLFRRSLPQPPAGCWAETVRRLMTTQERRQRRWMASDSCRFQGISDTWMGCGLLDRQQSKTSFSIKWSWRNLCKKPLIFYKLVLTCFISRHMVSYLKDNSHFLQWKYRLYLKTMQSVKYIHIVFHIDHIT